MANSTSARRWRIPLVVLLAAFVIVVGLLALSVPVKNGVREWSAPLVPGGWMAWTFPTALFFLVIFLLLLLMSVWEYASPGGNPRVGILRFTTTSAAAATDWPAVMGTAPNGSGVTVMSMNRGSSQPW